MSDLAALIERLTPTQKKMLLARARYTTSLRGYGSVSTPHDILWDMGLTDDCGNVNSFGRAVALALLSMEPNNE